VQREADDLAKPSPLESGILRRALGNAGRLLGGKSAAGLMQLATVALAARDLGLEQFGYFSVMLAQVQLLLVLATFQSNQAVVRYGVMNLGADSRAGFQGLIKFGTLLDLGAASLAAAAALLLAPVIARAADGGAAFVPAAQVLALLPITAAIGTPKGMLRLFGRFDLLARQVTLTPLARLIGTVALGFAGGSLVGYALVWVAAGAIGGSAAVFLAWREARRKDLLAGIRLSPRGAVRANPGIWRFSIFSNLHSSFLLLPGHIATLAVGIVLGPAAAGLMKVAQEIGTALAKPIDLVNQTVYPDIARLASTASWRRLRRLILRSGMIASAAGALIALVLFLGGRSVIDLLFGASFTGAYALLVAISLATTATVSVFAVDPALYAVGKPSRPLLTSILANLAFVGAMFAGFEHLGLMAAGLAYASAAVVTVMASLVWLRFCLPRPADQ
jgi:O-antigen/teichoic acid export membrane protein